MSTSQLDRYTLAVHTWNSAVGGPNFMVANAELLAARAELLAMIDEWQKWAPQDGWKYVRVSDETVAELSVTPSAPVMLKICEQEDGTLLLTAQQWEVSEK